MYFRALTLLLTSWTCLMKVFFSLAYPLFCDLLDLVSVYVCFLKLGRLMYSEMEELDHCAVYFTFLKGLPSFTLQLC